MDTVNVVPLDVRLTLQISQERVLMPFAVRVRITVVAQVGYTGAHADIMYRLVAIWMPKQKVCNSAFSGQATSVFII